MNTPTHRPPLRLIHPNPVIAAAMNSAAQDYKDGKLTVSQYWAVIRRAPVAVTEGAKS